MRIGGVPDDGGPNGGGAARRPRGGRGDDEPAAARHNTSRRGGRPRAAGRRVSVTSDQHGVRRVWRVVGLPLSGLVLLGWSLSCLVGDVRWGPLSILPVVLAALSPFLVVAAVPVVTLSVRRRAWYAAAPALVAGVLPWVFVLGHASGAPPPKGPTTTVRAMIVTAEDGGADAGAITAAVRRRHVDLLVITELSARLSHDLTQAGLTTVLTARWVQVPDPGVSPAAGIGIYSRAPENGITALPGTHWPAVVGSVDTGRGTFTLVAGHAVPPRINELARWRSDLEAFGDAARFRGPVVVLVNLNATPWHAQFRRIVSGRLHDSGDVLGRGLRPTWPSWSAVPLLPTDHALVAGVGVSSLDTTVIGGSDHRALSAELDVPDR